MGGADTITGLNFEEKIDFQKLPEIVKKDQLAKTNLTEYRTDTAKG